MTSVVTILACAWGLLCHRPLAIARGLFPWLLVAAALALLGRNPELRVVANLVTVFGFAFCISLFASTYAGIAYPDHARPKNIVDELKVAGIALWKTILVIVVLAVSAKAVLGIDLWSRTHEISLVVLILCLSFFVAESHLKETISLRRLAAAFAAMPLTMVTILGLALVWALGIELALDELNWAHKATLADPDVPAAVHKASTMFYVVAAAALTYLRIGGAVALFVALHAFWRQQKIPPHAWLGQRSDQPLPRLAGE